MGHEGAVAEDQHHHGPRQRHQRAQGPRRHQQGRHHGGGRRGGVPAGIGVVHQRPLHQVQPPQHVVLQDPGGQVGAGHHGGRLQRQQPASSQQRGQGHQGHGQGHALHRDHLYGS